MRMMLPGVASLLLLSALHSAALGVDTLDETEKKIIEKFNQRKSLTAMVETRIEQFVGTAQTVTKGDGRLEMRWDGGDVQVRFESEYQTFHAGQLDAPIARQSQASYHKGDSVHVLRRVAGQERGYKYPRVADIWNVPQLLREIRSSRTVTLLADETINGLEAWVIETVPTKIVDATRVHRTHYWIGKDSGVLLQRIRYDKFGDAIDTTRLVNVKLDGEIPASRFEFELPVGVSLEEMSAERVDL